ncbi:MAG: phytoene desaturase family protein, partial [Spirochaetota bacterium]
GPSLVTMPETFSAFFASFGHRLEDCFSLVKLDPICTYWFADGKVLPVRSDAETFDADAAHLFSEQPGAVLAYLKAASRIFAIAGELFLEQPIHEASTWLRPAILPRLLRIAAIDPLRSLHRRNTAFFTSPALVQLFDRYATYNGSNPWKTPGTMSIIPHVEYSGGGYTIREGIVAIPRAIEGICRTLGVEFHLDEAISRVERKAGRIAAVETAQAHYDVEAVVADIDPRPLFGQLLGEPEHPRSQRYSRLEPSSSAIVFFWGLGREDRRLGVNNIFFSADYEKEFHQIFSLGQVPTDPSIYINITSKESPGDAPPGKENWFVLVNTPPDRGQDWERVVSELRARILALLSAKLGYNVEASIEVESHLHPLQIAQATGSPGGSLYGIASNSPSASFSRQRNRVPEIPGLYCCGASAHPGGGMPLVLRSGMMAAELADRHEIHR